MKLLYKLEKKFGKYAIPNLMKYIVLLYGIGLVIGTMLPSYFYHLYMRLDFSMIMKGQVWRLFTFIIPDVSLSGNLLFLALKVYIYYMIGNALERAWGAFRFNLYFFSGIILNILASAIMYAFFDKIIPTSLEYVYGAMFYAFAVIYPDIQFLLFFIIPVKVKYLALLYTAYDIITIINSIKIGEFLFVIQIIVSMLNFLIYFFATRNYRRISPREFERKAKFKRQMNEARKQGNVTYHQGRNVITRHKCAICGRTELDDDQLEFRFCSKCDGNYEYCMDHLFTHEHVKK